MVILEVHTFMLKVPELFVVSQQQFVQALIHALQAWYFIHIYAKSEFMNTFKLLNCTFLFPLLEDKIYKETYITLFLPFRLNIILCYTRMLYNK